MSPEDERAVYYAPTRHAHASTPPSKECVMNRRQLIKTFPALVAASAATNAIALSAQAVSPQAAPTPPPYKGRLRPGVVAMSFRYELEAGKMTYEDTVKFIADLGYEGLDMTGYWVPPMLKFPAGIPSTQISEMVRETPADPSMQWMRSLRHTAYKNGVHIFSVGSPVKMAQKTPELRQKEIAFGKKWIDIADNLG